MTVVLLTGCGTITNVSSKPSEDLLVVCSKLVEQPFENFGDAIKANDYAIDMYIECAARHNKLVEFERKKQ